MPNQVSTFVKYTGIDCTTDTYTSYFRQFNHNGIFLISDVQQPIKELLVVNAKSNISFSKRVESSKLLIQGEIIFSVQYATNDSHHSIHYDKHILEFSEYLSVPKTASLNTHFSSKVFIEDIYSYIVSPEHIYHNVTLLISAHSS